MSKKICDRCGATTYKLFPYTFTDDFGDRVELKLCRDCDFDVMNGGDPFKDPIDIYEDRWEEEYEYDPVNTPPPWSDYL